MCSTFRFTAQWPRKKCINSIPYQKYIHSFHQEKNLTDPLTLQQQWHIGRERKKSRFLFKIYSSTIKRKKKNKIPRKRVLFNDGRILAEGKRTSRSFFELQFEFFRLETRKEGCLCKLSVNELRFNGLNWKLFQTSI